MASRFFLIFCGFYFCGILFHENWIFGLIPVFFGWQWQQDLRVLVLLVIAFLCGFLMFDYGGDELSQFYGEKVALYGYIAEEPDLRSEYVRYVVEVFAVLENGLKPGGVNQEANRDVDRNANRDEDQDASRDVNRNLNQDDVQVVSGKVLVSASRYPVHQLNEVVIVRGKLKKPEQFEDFDYESYLAKDGVYSIISYADIETTGKQRDGLGAFLENHLFRFKQIFEAKIDLLFTEPYGGFLKGLILGSRSAMNEEVLAKFNRTGLTHIVAISGYNITLIIVVVSNFLGVFRREVKIFGAIVFVVLFVILVGAGAAVVRAGIMGILGLVALFGGRKYNVFIALVASAFFMTFYNPKMLTYDLGFQFSVLATMGIICFYEMLVKRFSFIPDRYFMRENLAVTLSAQILVLPIMIYNFHRLSLVSFVVNVLILPLIPLIMLLGFLSVLISFIWMFAGKFMAFFAFLLMKLLLKIVDLFAAIPMAEMNFGGASKLTMVGKGMGVFLLSGYYVLIFMLFRKQISGSVFSISE